RLPTSMTLMVRTGAEPAEVAARIRGLVGDLNPDVPVSEIRTMESFVSGSMQGSRSMMWLFLGFAAAALLLAAIGTYSVVSYSAAQRTFEIGMRMALGATKRNIFSLVLGQSLRLVIAGLAVGVLVSLAVTRTLAAFLYGTTATDPVTFLGVCSLMVVVALLAGYIPARRAASVNPLKALRTE
ncbi:MAG: FtsX-like permease family protein, partial [Terriglobia bacterium]